MVTEARAFIADITLLNAFNVTWLYDRLIKMNGGTAVANEIVQSWISNFRLTAPSKDWGRPETFNMSGGRLHPLIKAEFDGIFARRRAQLTLLEVCRKIVDESGWGSDEESAMRSATQADFTAVITGLTGEDLKLFVLKNIDFYANRGNYKQHFGAAMDNFLMACRTTCETNTNLRLTELLRAVFADSKLGDDLEPPLSKDVSPAPASHAISG